MGDQNEQYKQLLQKLELLSKRQESLTKEIDELRNELVNRGTTEPEQVSEIKTETKKQPLTETDIGNLVNRAKEELKNKKAKTGVGPNKKTSTHFPNKPPKFKSNIEKFIGENLINKIGIIITILGVSIGVKYSIDHNLVSPTMRIIMGYLAGLLLSGIGIKLKRKYENYSAVLVSGAITIMYFITYAAYSFYSLFPQFIAFGLMVVFTVLAVYAAMKYNRQVIAHIGLVGAYAVPFLLSDDSGNVMVLFSYMTIINVGILLIAIKKYWKPLYFSSFILTWLIYWFWFETDFVGQDNFGLAFTFAILFFVIFYITFLVYKIRKNEKFEVVDIFLLMVNSFIFYGTGYAILGDQPSTEQFQGLFTLSNAIVHLMVGIAIFRKGTSDQNLYRLILGLVVLYLTLAVPVQFEGNWVTLLWVGEAALLFWIGRTKTESFYEILSYPLMLLAFTSLTGNWGTDYDVYVAGEPDTRITFLFNINFLTSVLFIGAFGMINLLNQNPKYPASPLLDKNIKTLVSFAIPAILFVSLYLACWNEIACYWDQFITDAASGHANGTNGPDSYGIKLLGNFKTIWLTNYSLFYLTTLSFVNIFKWKRTQLATINLVLNYIAIVYFLIHILFILGEISDDYLQRHAMNYEIGILHIGLRYISFVFLALLLFANHLHKIKGYLKGQTLILNDFVLVTTILGVASSELIHWMNLNDRPEPYKIGLSILWGIYALLMVAYGIWKKKKHLRIGGIILFGLTLMKLFLYDIWELGTVAKTVAFVSLGVLLLIVSFLYNKYKHFIFGDE